MSKFNNLKTSWKKFRPTKAHDYVGAKKPRNFAAVKHADKFLKQRWGHLVTVRKNTGIFMILVGVLILIIIFQTVLVSKNYSKTAPVRGGTFAVGVFGDIANLNPLYANTEAEVSATKMIFSSLFNYDKTGSLSSDVAKGFTVSKDRKNYMVDLRDDVYWQDDNRHKLTADDVVYTVNLMKMPAVGANQQASWSDVTAIKKSDYQVEFKLKNRYEPFPHALTFSILPKYVLEKYSVAELKSGNFNLKPIGSGPFVAGYSQKVDKGQGFEDGRKVLNLTKNDKYYGSQAKVNRIQLYGFLNKNDIAKSLERASVHAVSGLDSASTQKIQKDGQFNLVTTRTSGAVYAILNTATGFNSDHNVRKALQLGTNVDKALGEVANYTKRLDYPFVADISAMKNKKPELDLNQAKALLEKSGWHPDSKTGFRKKDGKELVLSMVMLKDPKYETVVKRLADQWAALGIKTNITVYNPSDPSQNFAASVLGPRNYDVLVQELNTGADPDVYAYWHSSQANPRGLNFSNYNNIISDEFLESARNTSFDIRQSKYDLFSKQWFDDVPAIGLYQTFISSASRKNVSFVDKDTNLITGSDQFYFANQWTSQSDEVYKTP